MKILVFNAGSSSQKSCLYEWSESLASPVVPLWQALATWESGGTIAPVTLKIPHRSEVRLTCPSSDPAIVAGFLLETLHQGENAVLSNLEEIQIVGHRVVHGGTDYQESVRITPEVKAAIDRWAEFAPLHNPANLAGIEAIEAILGSQIPQVAVFDTAFHGTLSPAAYTYPGTYAWREQGIRRYGFHGTSHHYCSDQLQRYLQQQNQPAAERVLIAHLGNGCSVTAVQHGRSIDTSMGFTPLDGLMMGTRSGSVDPGILIYLLRQNQCSLEELDDLLNRKSGLLGLSGLSNDLRSLLAAIEAGNDRAKLAFDVFIHRLRSVLGALLASLGGLDAIVFTAGIGENSDLVRAKACEAFSCLGLEIDPVANETGRGDRRISQPHSAVQVWVIHTEEEWMIAREAGKVLGVLGN